MKKLFCVLIFSLSLAALAKEREQPQGLKISDNCFITCAHNFVEAYQEPIFELAEKFKDSSKEAQIYIHPDYFDKAYQEQEPYIVNPNDLALIVFEEKIGSCSQVFNEAKLQGDQITEFNADEKLKDKVIFYKQSGLERKEGDSGKPIQYGGKLALHKGKHKYSDYEYSAIIVNKERIEEIVKGIKNK